MENVWRGKPLGSRPCPVWGGMDRSDVNIEQVNLVLGCVDTF